MADDLESKLVGFKLFLEIVLYCSVVGYGVFGVWRSVELARKHHDKARKKCGKICRKVCGKKCAARCGKWCGRWCGARLASFRRSHQGEAAETKGGETDVTGLKAADRARSADIDAAWTVNPVTTEDSPSSSGGKTQSVVPGKRDASTDLSDADRSDAGGVEMAALGSQRGSSSSSVKPAAR